MVIFEQLLSKIAKPVVLTIRQLVICTLVILLPVMPTVDALPRSILRPLTVIFDRSIIGPDGVYVVFCVVVLVVALVVVPALVCVAVLVAVPVVPAVPVVVCAVVPVAVPVAPAVEPVVVLVVLLAVVLVGELVIVEPVLWLVGEEVVK